MATVVEIDTMATKTVAEAEPITTVDLPFSCYVVSDFDSLRSHVISSASSVPNTVGGTTRILKSPCVIHSRVP
ncbi:hypothetical protein OAM67_00575 [bacterium]|nr:hypothetical protein [bacterium]